MTRRRNAGFSLSVAAALAAFTLVTASPALAEPPPWAPAHGYRAKKAKKTYVGTVPHFDIDLGTCNRELLGSLLGAAAGAAVGSQIGDGRGQMVAIAGGTIIGFLVGGGIGRSMDRVDQNCVGQALERAPTGRTVAWKNPDTGAAYSVTPVSTYQDGQNRYCREYSAVGTIGGKQEQLYGKACLQPDGSWQFVD